MVRTKDICDKNNRFATSADERKDDYTQVLRDTFRNNIAWETVTRNTNTTKRDVWISKGDLSDKTVGYEKILSYPYNPVVFQLGDYVNWNGKRYLVESLNNNRIYEVYGRMYECNETLKWYDDNGVLQEWEAVIFSRNQTISFAEDKNMRLPKGSIYGFVQMNSDTSNLEAGSQFIIGSGKSRGKYEITFENDFENDNLLKLNFERYQKNEELDDLENGIANFENRPRFTISSSISNSQLTIGNDVQLDVTLLDKDGQVSDKPLAYSTSDSAICTVSDSGLITPIALGSCTIKAEMTNNSNVSSEIAIEVVAVPVDSFTYVLSPDVSSIYRLSDILFDVQGQNNAVDISETYTFNFVKNVSDDDRLIVSAVDSDTFSVRNTGTSGSLEVEITPVSRPQDVFAKTFNISGAYG